MSTLIKFFTLFDVSDLSVRDSVATCRKAMRGIAEVFCGLFIAAEVINTILPAASQISLLSLLALSSSVSLYSSLSVLPSQLLAGFSAHGALGCKALHVKGEGETNKSALVLQKQAHRCMPVKRSVRLLWLPLIPSPSLHQSTPTPRKKRSSRESHIHFLSFSFPLSCLSPPLPMRQVQIALLEQRSSQPELK